VAIHHPDTRRFERGTTDAGDRDPRAAQREPDARIRTPQAPVHPARWPPCDLLRLALPTLRRLSEAGWITEEEPLDPAAAGVARSRRGKRVYRLTAEGKEHLSELLAEVGPDAFEDEGFGARLAFFAQTRADIRLKVLEGRRRRVEEQRDGLRSAMTRTGERLDRYTRQLHEHGLESSDREVRWLTELIEQERTHYS